MIPAPFQYERAESVDHAISLLGQYGEDAKLLAGGHSLLPLMKLRLARPSALVDIGRLQDLSYVREDGDRIAIGALTRHHDVHHSPVLEEHCPIVSHTAGLIGDPQVRHMGTIGGSAAHGDPASDMPTVLLALDADMVLQGPDGTRTVPATSFFTGLFETALSPHEVLTELRVPRFASSTGWSYVKFHRRAQDWAIVGVATVLERSNGDVSRASVALTNMGQTPRRAGIVELALAGGASPEEAAQGAGEGLRPPSDTFATAEYRSEMAKVMARRSIEEALSRGPGR